MGPSILYPTHPKNMEKNRPAKSFKTDFLTGFWLPGPIQIDFFSKTVQNPLFRPRFRFFSTQFVQDSPFFLICHAKSRSKFPPVWPIPIETPQPSLQGLIHPYWLSTHLTQAILTYHISIHHTFLSGIASPYTKHIFSIFEIILPYRFFSHPTCKSTRQPDKLSPQATRPSFYMRFPYISKKSSKFQKFIRLSVHSTEQSRHSHLNVSILSLGQEESRDPAGRNTNILPYPYDVSCNLSKKASFQPAGSRPLGGSMLDV